MAADDTIEVQVAPRRSIHKRTKGGMKVFSQHSKVTVPKSDVGRLVRQGFIVDPKEKPLTQAEIDAASLAHAIPGAKNVSISEDDPRSIKPAGRSATS